jgi:hypothetical protein
VIFAIKFEIVSELIHKELLELTTDIHKENLLNSMKKLENQLVWIKTKDEPIGKKATQDEIVRMKLPVREEKKIKKQVIIYEKRDGNKMTFYFN